MLEIVTLVGMQIFCARDCTRLDVTVGFGRRSSRRDRVGLRDGVCPRRIGGVLRHIELLPCRDDMCHLVVAHRWCRLSAEEQEQHSTVHPLWPGRSRSTGCS